MHDVLHLGGVQHAGHQDGQERDIEQTGTGDGTTGLVEASLKPDGERRRCQETKVGTASPRRAGNDQREAHSRDKGQEGTSSNALRRQEVV